jgi:hypothetical protein
MKLQHKLFSSLALSLFLTATSNSQDKFPEIKVTGCPCCWDGKDFATAMKGIQLFDFGSDGEAQEWAEKICSASGIPMNFSIRASNVPNAVAMMEGRKRSILFNPNFMAKMDTSSGTNWGSVSILAHEIGHHLSGHTLDEGGSRPPTELEADVFSGFVLGRLGAELDEACAAMKTMPDVGSATHPPSSARVVAITKGWKNARNQDKKLGTIAQTEPDDDPVPQKTVKRRPVERDSNEDDQRMPAEQNQQAPQPIARIVIMNNPNVLVLTNCGQIVAVDQVGRVMGIFGMQSPPALAGMAWDIQTSTGRMGVTPNGQVIASPGPNMPPGVVGYVTGVQ